MLANIRAGLGCLRAVLAWALFERMATFVRRREALLRAAQGFARRRPY